MAMRTLFGAATLAKGALLNGQCSLSPCNNLARKVAVAAVRIVAFIFCPAHGDVETGRVSLHADDQRQIFLRWEIMC